MPDDVQLRAATRRPIDVESLSAENLRLKEELLAARDTIVGQEARLGEALGEVRRLEAELVRYREAMEELDRIKRSRAWPALQMLRRLRALVTQR